MFAQPFSTEKPSRHRQRIYDVMDNVRLDSSVSFSLDRLADMACMSKFHFGRMFCGLTGETPYQHVARLRLENAVGKIFLDPKVPLTEIALSCGFSGSDVFSRSFTSRYGVSPREFRKRIPSNGPLQRGGKLEEELLIQPGDALLGNDLAGLEVKIRRCPEYHVAYIRHLGPYGDINRSITKTFDRLRQWARDRKILTKNSTFLGRTSDNCLITPARLCLYDACLVLDHPIAADGVVSTQVIKADTCAVLEVSCEHMMINRYWAWLYQKWLCRSGFTVSQNPSYELFPRRGFQTPSARNGVSLCVPIQAGVPEVSQ